LIKSEGKVNYRNHHRDREPDPKKRVSPGL